MNDQENTLVGTWKSDPNDKEGAEMYGRVTLNFGADGSLLYITHGDEHDQIIKLTYRVGHGVIVTDQPSQPQIETTEFELTPDGHLLLAFGGHKSRYVRG